MFDQKLLRENPELLRKAVAAKRSRADLDRLIALDEQRRELTRQIDTLNTERNTASKQIGARIKAGEDAETAKAAVRELGDRIAAAEAEFKTIAEEFDALADTVPNIPHESTPIGTSEEDNQVVGEWGEKPRVRIYAQTALGSGRGAGDLGPQAGDQDRGVGVLCAQGGRGAAGAGADPVVHRRARERVRLHRNHGRRIWSTRRRCAGRGNCPRWPTTCIRSRARTCG